MDLGSRQVTVPKARRILGKYSEELTDDQVREIIHTLHLLAKEQLCYNSSNIEVSSYGSNTINQS